MIHLELFARFLLISLLAFGGGQAALPLIERVTVQQTGWLSASTFGAALAFGYATPGPVLIVATFVGHQVAGLSGALAATVGAFIAPWALAALAAQQIRRYMEHRTLQAFGRAAAPAVVGVLGVTVVSMGSESFVAWPAVAIAAVVCGMTMWTAVHPLVLLVIAAVLAAVVRL